MNTIRDIVTLDEVQDYFNGEETYEVFERIFEFYMNSGEMPYGIAKGRSGDLYTWIYDRLEKEFGNA